MNGNLRHRLGQAWSNLAEGWHDLRERAWGALTHFAPHHGNAVQTREEALAARASRWGVLAAEMHDAGDKLLVRLEVPGMEPEDFDVRVEGDLLLVRGEKRVEREQHNGECYLMERAYGSFERVVPLPVAVEAAGVQARYRRGVLQLSLPKTQRARRQRIRVESR